MIPAPCKLAVPKGANMKSRYPLEAEYRKYFTEVRKFDPFPDTVSYENVVDLLEWHDAQTKHEQLLDVLDAINSLTCDDFCSDLDMTAADKSESMTDVERMADEENVRELPVRCFQKAASHA